MFYQQVRISHSRTIKYFLWNDMTMMSGLYLKCYSNLSIIAVIWKPLLILNVSWKILTINFFWLGVKTNILIVWTNLMLECVFWYIGTFTVFVWTTCLLWLLNWIPFPAQNMKNTNIQMVNTNWLILQNPSIMHSAIIKCFVYQCLPFCWFSLGHCIVCTSLIYGLWLHLWCLLLSYALFINVDIF